MKDFYTVFYDVIEHSQAHHEFCERAFGMDLCQHGFADSSQLELLLKVTRLGPEQHVLDVGCGNGMIAEYLSNYTGAHVTGLDYIPHAIEQARLRTASKSDRFTFIVGDINRLELPVDAYDLVLSVDSIYFSTDYQATLKELKATLRPAGQLALFYSYGWEPWVPKTEFPKEKLPPGRTPLAEALNANGLAFNTWDLTSQDYQLALRRRSILSEMKGQFEAEGALFIYENRLGEAEGICRAVEEGLHARYLYLAQADGDLPKFAGNR